MKSFVKYAIAGAVALAASSAYADVALPSSGNGGVVLVVRDKSDPSRTYYADLGVTMNQILSESSITGPAPTPGVPINSNWSGFNFTSSGLATFMSTASGLGYEYALFGGDIDGDSSTASPVRFLATTETQYSSLTPSTLGYAAITPNGTRGAGLDGFIQENNDLLAGANEMVGSTFGADATNGAEAASFWGAPGLGLSKVTTNVGTATNLYVFTSNDTSAGKARVYQFADIRLDLDGHLQSLGGVVNPEVPLPAAVWLLGSALVGLGTVRRRRNGEVAA